MYSALIIHPIFAWHLITDTSPYQGNLLLTKPANMWINSFAALSSTNLSLSHFPSFCTTSINLMNFQFIFEHKWVSLRIANGSIQTKTGFYFRNGAFWLTTSIKLMISIRQRQYWPWNLRQNDDRLVQKRKCWSERYLSV